MAKRRNRHISKKSKVHQNIQQIVQPHEFRINEYPIQSDETFEELIHWIERIKRERDDPSPSWSVDLLKQVLNLLTETATEVWRARKKLIIPGTDDQPIEEMKPIYRPLDSAYQNLQQAGLKVYDLTKQPYVIGMIERVIAFEPTPGITREMIIETIKPTIYYQDQLMQVGEVIVGTVEK